MLNIIKLSTSTPGGEGYSHIFMGTYARCTWMGFETKMYKHSWVIFLKIVKLRYTDGFWVWIFGTRMGLTVKIKWNLVTGWVLSRKFWYMAGFEHKIWYMDGWVDPTKNQAYVSTRIPSTPGLISNSGCCGIRDLKNEAAAAVYQFGLFGLDKNIFGKIFMGIC